MKASHDNAWGELLIPGGSARVWLTPDIWQVLDAADMAKRGFLPAGGGWLDQTQVGIEAIRAAWHDREYAESRLRQTHG